MRLVRDAGRGQRTRSLSWDFVPESHGNPTPHTSRLCIDRPLLARHTHRRVVRQLPMGLSIIVARLSHGRDRLQAPVRTTCVARVF